jgi:hypothetical protein
VARGAFQEDREAWRQRDDGFSKVAHAISTGQVRASQVPGLWQEFSLSPDASQGVDLESERRKKNAHRFALGRAPHKQREKTENRDRGPIEETSVCGDKQIPERRGKPMLRDGGKPVA